MSSFILNIFIVGLLCLCFGNCQKQDDIKNISAYKPIIAVDNVSQYSEARQYWTAAEKSLKKSMGRYIRNLMPMVMREVYSRNVSSDCLNGLLQLTSGLRKLKLWAFEMVDANGKLPEGFFAGSLSILGDFNQCLNIDIKESKQVMKSQYCTVEVNPPLPKWHPFLSMHIPPLELANISGPDTVLTHLSKLLHNLYVVHIRWGICLPSQCTFNDTQNLIQIVPEQTGIDWKFNVSRCETKQTLTFTYTQTVILVIFGILSFLLACGTIIGIIWDVETFSANGIFTTTFQYIQSFSVFSNSRKLAQYTSKHEHLAFVHGTIFICMFWIIISNAFMYVNYHVASNFIEALRVSKYLFFQIVLNRSIPIQTFFFISGFVAAYKWTKAPAGSISIWKYILKRYLRYTPTYLLMIGLSMTVPTWGSGPSWQEYINPIYEKCYNTWWGNFLYINNFLDMETSCLNHTWIFAVDAQLHLFGLLILIPLSRKPKIGLMLNFVLLGASLLTVALTNVYYDIPPSETISFIHGIDRAYYASRTFFRIYTHFCMYCSGIATGYFIAEKPNLKIPKKLVSFIWALIIVVGLSVICVVKEWNDGDLPTPLINAIYATFGKVGWAVTLAWGAISCANGYGGGLNDFLGWRPFSFFSRLSFIAYIFHPVLITISYSFRKSHFYVDQFDFIYSIMSHLISVFFLSYLCHLAFEGPFLSLTKVICTKMKNGCTGFDTNEKHNSNNVCNGVLTEKPMKYEEKLKMEDKLPTTYKTKF